jgi:hypothetical protein
LASLLTGPFRSRPGNFRERTLVVIAAPDAGGVALQDWRGVILWLTAGIVFLFLSLIAVVPDVVH